MTTHKVVVTVHDAKSQQEAVEQVSHMLNGCYERGEIVYPVDVYRSRRVTRHPLYSDSKED